MFHPTSGISAGPLSQGGTGFIPTRSVIVAELHSLTAAKAQSYCGATGAGI
jgi:hypothetical protein